MKNIFITGGSYGIGYELVKLFSAHRSWHVITCSRTESRNQILRSFSEYIDAYTIDLGELKQRLSFLEDTLIKFPLNAVILNAAVAGISEINNKETSADYVKQVNLYANIDILEKTLPKLRDARGIIVFMSSGIISESDRDPITDLYAETKKKCEEYILKIAKEKENQTVKFLIIHPGMTATRLHLNILKIGTGKLFERTKKALEQRKLRNPYVVAKIIKNFVVSCDLAKDTIIDISENLYQETLEE